jgi:hypothetical protein
MHCFYANPDPDFKFDAEPNPDHEVKNVGFARKSNSGKMKRIPPDRDPNIDKMYIQFE